MRCVIRPFALPAFAAVGLAVVVRADEVVPAAAVKPTGRPTMTMLDRPADADPFEPRSVRPDPKVKKLPAGGRPLAGVRAAVRGQEVRGLAARGQAARDRAPTTLPARNEAQARPRQAVVEDAIAWLAAAQHKNGGWGANRPHVAQPDDGREPGRPAVTVVDAATTSLVTSAFVRVGHTPSDGERSGNVRRGTEFLCTTVEEYKEPGPRITAAGTHVQNKLGPLVDTLLTTHCLARVLPCMEAADPLRARVDKALDVCLAKMAAGQESDGTWNVAEGWAPVLQTALGCAALEMAENAGKKVDAEMLDRARSAQKRNIDAQGQIVADRAAAGVALYALAGAQRANAIEARVAEDLVAWAHETGRLKAAALPTVETLQRIGIQRPASQRLAGAHGAIAQQRPRLDDDALLQGHGTLGGEEYLSYALLSEAMVIAGGTRGQAWNDSISDRLAAVQNPDGSWSGHHCISSAVFCTAAAVQCLTVDSDRTLFLELTHRTTEQVAGGVVGQR